MVLHTRDATVLFEWQYIVLWRSLINIFFYQFGKKTNWLVYGWTVKWTHVRCYIVWVYTVEFQRYHSLVTVRYNTPGKKSEMFMQSGIVFIKWSYFGLIKLTHPSMQSDAHMCQWIGSTLAHVMACRLVGVEPSYVNQYWLFVNRTHRNSVLITIRIGK